MTTDRRAHPRQVRLIPTSCICETDVIEKDDRLPILIRMRDNDCPVHGVHNEAWEQYAGPSPASTRHPDDHRDPFTRGRETKALNRDFLAAISVGAPAAVREYLDGIAGRLDAAGWVVVEYSDSGNDAGMWSLVERAVHVATPLIAAQVRAQVAGEIEAVGERRSLMLGGAYLAGFNDAITTAKVVARGES